MHKMNKVKSEKLQASYAIAAAQNLYSQFNVFIFQTLPNDIFSTRQFVLGMVTQNWMMKAQLPQLEN